MIRICNAMLLVAAAAAAQPAPVLVELFTSEGCSDCPPADRLLEQLDQAQPVPGAEIIVLSEHVDYWDRLGWKDPFSAHFFSERQEEYARRFRIDGPYTPQMVVDGEAEFVGSNGKQAVAAIQAATRHPKVSVRISHLNGNGIRVEVDAMPGGGSDVYLAVVEKSGASQVLRGENRGRSLHHVAIARRIVHLGKCKAKTPFAQEMAANEAASGAFRLVAFVQDGGSGAVRGAAVLR